MKPAQTRGALFTCALLAACGASDELGDRPEPGAEESEGTNTEAAEAEPRLAPDTSPTANAEQVMPPDTGDEPSENENQVASAASPAAPSETTDAPSQGTEPPEAIGASQGAAVSGEANEPELEAPEPEPEPAGAPDATPTGSPMPPPQGSAPEAPPDAGGAAPTSSNTTPPPSEPVQTTPLPPLPNECEYLDQAELGQAQCRCEEGSSWSCQSSGCGSGGGETIDFELRSDLSCASVERPRAIRSMEEFQLATSTCHYADDFDLRVDFDTRMLFLATRWDTYSLDVAGVELERGVAQVNVNYSRSCSGEEPPGAVVFIELPQRDEDFAQRGCAMGSCSGEPLP